MEWQPTQEKDGITIDWVRGTKKIGREHLSYNPHALNKAYTFYPNIQDEDEEEEIIFFFNNKEEIPEYPVDYKKMK